jgi:hypothetical protein
MKQCMGGVGAKRGAILLRAGLATATLGWLAIVVSGCAVTKAPEAPTGVLPVRQAGVAAYTQAVVTFAREVGPLVSQAPDGGAGATAEAEGCALEEEDGEYGGALYSPDEPLASGIELVSAEDDCNKEDIACTGAA